MVDFLDLEKIKWSKGHYGLAECWVKIKVPSVSAVISEMIPDPELEEFIRSVGKEKADEISKQAAYRGTAMHLFLENFLKVYSKSRDVSEALSHTQKESPRELLEKEVPQNKIDEGRDLFYNFYYSEHSNSFANLVGTELSIYSPTLFYRGKLDVFYVDKAFGYAVTDHKTSSSYIKEGSTKEYKYKLQLGSYANALDEMYRDKGLVVKKASILCMSTKSKIPQEVSCNGAELEKYKEEFKTICREWHIKNKTDFLLK